jgi:hypothetical protein
MRLFILDGTQRARRLATAPMRSSEAGEPGQ